MPDTHIRLHRDILWLVLDKQPLNPLTVGMLGQLTAGLRKAKQERPRLVVITSMGEQAFCAGVELEEDVESQRVKLLRCAQEVDEAFNVLRQQKIATVALVKGKALGAGCELVTFCETVIARDDATFRLPTMHEKIFPSALSVYLPKLVGQETATRLVQSEETLTALQAQRLGLAHQVIPGKSFLSDSEELLVMLANIGPEM
ncbi:MAG TPA: enoyl-CoA hydratase/isomerase family protein [Ktedonobacteraceae bacterium]|nr:enoyl-CoA hydratase/isomerase family protein [Ktedonobacteraceae bacterium]